MRQLSYRDMLLWSLWSAILLLTPLEAAEEEEDVRAGQDVTFGCGWNIHNRIFIFTSYIDTIVFVDCVSVHVFVYRLQHSCEWPGVYCWWLLECRSLRLWNGQAVAYQHHQPVWHQFPLHTGTVNCIILYVLHTEHIHFRAHTLPVHI